MGKIFTTAILLLGSLILANVSHAVDIIHYGNKPVTIELHKGEERTIQFGDNVKVGITKGQQAEKLFRIQSAQGAVHFLPYESFDKQRIQVKRISDNRVILIDLISFEASSKSKTLEDIKIVLDIDDIVENDAAALDSNSDGTNITIITPVDLTRFVSQQLYGPSRLHRDLRGVSESALGIKGAIKLFGGENKYKTKTVPVVAFQGGGHYLTALHVKNLDSAPVTLSYLDLNVPFTHATFQHHRLHPIGTPGDSTTLYLISDRPLKETLYPWTYYRDAVVEAKQAALLKHEEEKNERPKKHGPRR